MSTGMERLTWTGNSELASRPEYFITLLVGTTGTTLRCVEANDVKSKTFKRWLAC